MGIIFSSGEEMSKVLTELHQELLKEEENKEKFREKGVVVKFQISDPDGSTILDPQEPDLISSKSDLEPDINIKMKADFMHDFWLGKTNIVESIKSGHFKVEMGRDIAAAKLIDLLPILARGLDIYPSLCEKHGITT